MDWDHPRVCGEQGLYPGKAPQFLGSPPRVRGTADANARFLTNCRITPACAGNRLTIWPGGEYIQDHPRVCGEQVKPFLESDGAIGSPPRVRGTDIGLPPRLVDHWITPACAGNSAWWGVGPGRTGDHPRVCGEQYDINHAWVCAQGSPPRVRGTASLKPDKSSFTRITPACAGNRLYSLPLPRISGDHPRVCGEQYDANMENAVEVGSPPRVRGTVDAADKSRVKLGITPACAGNRLKKARHFYILFCQIKRIHLV